jgi:hypothetical protein
MLRYAFDVVSHLGSLPLATPHAVLHRVGPHSLLMMVCSRMQWETSLFASTLLHSDWFACTTRGIRYYASRKKKPLFLAAEARVGTGCSNVEHHSTLASA